MGGPCLSPSGVTGLYEGVLTYVAKSWLSPKAILWTRQLLHFNGILVIISDLWDMWRLSVSSSVFQAGCETGNDAADIGFFPISLFPLQ